MSKSFFGFLALVVCLLLLGFPGKTMAVKLSGIQLLEDPDGPSVAQDLGLEKNDIILKINDIKIDSEENLKKALKKLLLGSKLTLQVYNHRLRGVEDLPEYTITPRLSLLGETNYSFIERVPPQQNGPIPIGGKKVHRKMPKKSSLGVQKIFGKIP